MKRMISLVIGSVLFCGSAQAQMRPPQCENVSLEDLSSSMVQITMEYHEPDQNGFVGKRATGVFVSDTVIATVEHVMTEYLAGEVAVFQVGWSMAIGEGVKPENDIELPVASVELVDVGLNEKVALVNLPAGIMGRTVSPVEYQPVTDKEPVFGLAYRDGLLRFAQGQHLLPEYSNESTEGETEVPPLLFELADWDTNDRSVFGKGSSGGAVYNCSGKLVAIMSEQLTADENDQAVQQLRRAMRSVTDFFGSIGHKITIQTDWGQPNIAGLHASVILLE